MSEEREIWVLVSYRIAADGSPRFARTMPQGGTVVLRQWCTSPRKADQFFDQDHACIFAAKLGISNVFPLNLSAYGFQG